MAANRRRRQQRAHLALEAQAVGRVHLALLHAAQRPVPLPQHHRLHRWGALGVRAATEFSCTQALRPLLDITAVARLLGEEGRQLPYESEDHAALLRPAAGSFQALLPAASPRMLARTSTLATMLTFTTASPGCTVIILLQYCFKTGLSRGPLQLC